MLIKIILATTLLFCVLCVVQSQKCSVTIEGYHFDLSKLIRGDQDYKFTDSNNGDVYYFNICNNTVGDNPCGNQMIAYKYDVKNKRCLGLGSKREYYSIHNNGGDSGPSIIVAYRGGDQIPSNPRSRYELAYVFQCDPNAGDGEPVVLEPNEYGVVVQWKSKYGCLAAYSQLIINRDYEDFKSIENQFNNKKDNIKEYLLQRQKLQQNLQDENEEATIDQDDYFVKKNAKLVNKDTQYIQYKQNKNDLFKQNKENEENQHQYQNQQLNQQNENKNEQEDEQSDNQQQDDVNQNENENENENVNLDEDQESMKVHQIKPVYHNENIKANEINENEFSPAFADKVIPGIRDLDKLNMNNNYNKKASQFNDKQNDYLEILKNTYKEQNQFTPPEANIRNQQIVHKNDEIVFA